MRSFNIIKASHSLKSFLQVSVISNMAVKLNYPIQAWIIFPNKYYCKKFPGNLCYIKHGSQIAFTPSNLKSFPNEYNCKKIKLNEIKIDLVQ